VAGGSGEFYLANYRLPTISLPISDCQLPIEKPEISKIGNRQLAIGND
jgi:hypothetical protein